MLEMSHQENRVLPSASDDDAGVLSQESGLRGCWFRCKVLRVNRLTKSMKVQYHDVLHIDEPDKLMETVPIRVANPDRLGLRLNGRSMIRPWPQHDDASELIEFELGKQVDVWWCNGWWEGVMIEQDQSSNSKFKIYLPGENEFLTVERKDLRISKEWFGGQWVNVEAKRDILSLIRSQ